ncbi:hypothetical protein [Chryseolinea soli]|uniref:Uncharacterized protein n=1 Tax=Chryseolinea soli TaxID=2321403 RepID=A0A385SNW7_9BACT|nr:hypothetical protein [Chryseolinea soli]AYB31957.1 hypothetical protein D4L85_15910 [Chryseolinea soli]
MSSKYVNRFGSEHQGFQNGAVDLPFVVKKKNIHPSKIRSSFKSIMRKINDLKGATAMRTNDRPDND